jgi:ATP-binding cassette subfamily B protein
MTTDVTNTQQSFAMVIRIVVRAPLMLIFSAVMAFVTGGNMAWIFVAAIPVIGIIFFILARFAMSIFRRVFKRYDALNESVQENVAGMRVVKSFVREEYEDNKFSTASTNLSKEFIKAEKIVALMTPLMNTSIHVVYLLTMYFAASIIFKTAQYVDDSFVWGELSLGQMSALLTYGIQILMSIMMISMIVTMLVMSFESIRRIGEVLDEEPTIVDPDNPVMEVNDGSVIFNNVSFKYKKEAERYSVSNLNINIKSGEFVGIIGSTGSGKSTLVNLISRLYDTTEGEVIVGGHNVKEYGLEPLRNSVAMVLQKNFLFSGTIASNMRWGNKEATDEEIVEAITTAQIPDILNHYPEGIEHVVEQGGANFSGGQKQRLCIARAILKKPKILILDDSTSAVDTKTDKLIRRALKEDLPEMTKIVIAQRISSIEDADQIIVLDNGEINAIGNHDYLLKNNEIYREVYQSQTQKGGN